MELQYSNIKITKAANGFIITRDFEHKAGIVYFVFETIDNLLIYLKDELTKGEK